MSGAARLDAVDRGIPRRLSACRDDRAFDHGMVARLNDRVMVMLDGVELEEVASWDVDKNAVTRRMRRADGNLITDEAGRPAIEVLTGEVEVRWKPGTFDTPRKSA